MAEDFLLPMILRCLEIGSVKGGSSAEIHLPGGRLSGVPGDLRNSADYHSVSSLAL